MQTFIIKGIFVKIEKDGPKTRELRTIEVQGHHSINAQDRAMRYKKCISIIECIEL